ncbi:MAG: hypothetical protein H8K03_20310 [Nitrospira sp.]
MTRISGSLLSVAMVAVFSLAPAFAETAEKPETVWACPQADGSILYTNKERDGCQALRLKPLPVVPNVKTMPTIPHPIPDTTHNREQNAYQKQALSEIRGHGAGVRQRVVWEYCTFGAASRRSLLALLGMGC